MGVLLEPCNWEVEAREVRVQSHHQFYIKFKASMGFIRSCLRKQTNKKIGTGKMVHWVKVFATRLKPELDHHGACGRRKELPQIFLGHQE